MNNTKVFKCTEYETEKEYDASVSIVKHKMKNEIRKTSIPSDINPKHIYNEISEEIGLIYESEYYINERDENFMIFKNSNIIIFQSPFQTELIKKKNSSKYNNNIIVTPKILHCDFEK
ncbi:hypothetical protein U3516DRAFT_772122, partial [Neocallimastix sp. 'constans']